MNPTGWLATVVLAAALGACGGSDADPATAADVSAIVAVSGDGQTAPVATLLAAPLIAEVRDAAGLPLPGRAVTFVVTRGNGSVFLGTTVTDADGRARERWTLGPPAIGQQVEARVVTRDGTALAATFDATAQPGPVTRVGFLPGPHGDGRAPQGSTLNPLPFGATDAYGNGVPGVPLTFTPDAGGRADPPQATTGADGSVLVTWTLGIPIGLQTLTVSSPGVADFVMTYVADKAPAGPPASLELQLGDGQTVVQHGRLPEPLVVWVADAFRNGSPNVTVHFAPEAGSGGVRPEDVTSSYPLLDAGGYASWRGWFHSAGRQRIVASVAGLPPVTFTVDVTPSPHRFDGAYRCQLSDGSGAPVDMSIDAGVVSGAESGDPSHVLFGTTLDEASGALTATVRASLDVRYLMTATLAVGADDSASLDGVYTITSIGTPVGNGTWHCDRL